ncbi:hypothetical protein BG015_004112 [Linnemannia schmuckeri]|uniref:2-methylcitrate dehydratase n=1 Tax=Linnemannia schmuckeri TaxID=64567 RepID=A0A9P5REB9_9FUNG|nr:hypothetical protein BG015_004112 [Linnemannia schmuckeri]
MSSNVDLNNRPEYDQVLQDIADYVLTYMVDSPLALDTARNSLMDTLGCGLLSLHFPECTKHLGPIVEGTIVPCGARVPGTNLQLDPVKAAWDIGCTIRWLDYNDTWLAAEWGHPSDNLGAILAVADHVSQKCVANGEVPLTMREVLDAMIMAHEIQGVIALENSFNRVGLDHVLLVKVASTAVAAKLMGASREQMLSALSHAFVDGQALRTYRHAPNAGSRKSWAAGDATSRAVHLADIAMRGEMGIPELFKISFPAEFHAQTACEAAVMLHPLVRNRISEIDRITITTHESAIRIISKVGPLVNAADRDHCLQYMTAVPLAFGTLVAEHYEDEFHAAHPIIDQLRDKMEIIEDPRYSREYLEADKRSIANAIQVFFNDGSSSAKVDVEYPIGHRRRRADGIPLLEEKFKSNLATHFAPQRCEQIFAMCKDQVGLEAMPVHQFVEMWVG